MYIPTINIYMISVRVVHAPTDYYIDSTTLLHKLSVTTTNR